MHIAENKRSNEVIIIKKWYMYLSDMGIIIILQPSLDIFVVVLLLTHVGLFVTPWIAAHQASLSFTVPGAC